MMRLPEAYEKQQPLHRALAMEDVTVAEDDWTVTGRLVPYGVPTEIGPGVIEEFEPGAFARAANAPGRIKFRGVAGARSDGHLGEVVGHATVIEDRPDGPVGTFKIVDTTAGRDTMTLLRSQVLDELSIEFTTLPDQFVVRRTNGQIQVRHRRARLLAVSPVPVGAYGRDALVTQVRSEHQAARDAILAHLRGLRA